MSALLLVLLSVVPPAAGTVARTPPAGPDRPLFLDAQKGQAVLEATPRLAEKPREWERVVLLYRKVTARYPQGTYADAAVLAVGDLYRKMAVRFKVAHYNDDAVQAYRSLVSDYPSSRLGEKALYAVLEMAQGAGDRRKVTEAARAYLSTFPDSPRAGEVKALIQRSGPAQAASLPSPPPPGLVQVYNLRSWSGDSSTRVVLYLEREVQIKQDRIQSPDRLYVDLMGTRLHPNLVNRSFPVGDGLLEQVRIAQNRESVVRVVLDFKSVRDANVLFLQDPTRLVIDVRGAGRVENAALSAPAPPLPLPSPSPEAKRSGPSDPPRIDVLPLRKGPDIHPVVPAPPARTAFSFEAPAKPSPVPALVAPSPPQVNRAGNYSMARQLGLGAGKIVIDAGHGGHDPGTIGRGGLMEKDLVLDVALRLEALVREELGADVVMTRSTDAFVPLEERTAIANSREADLFLSIHANSSPSPEARGIETYFLNFAADRHAEAVAARENSISDATLKDLQGLLKAIALNTKIDESRDFASSVQEAMVQDLKTRYPGALDRGVHTAPFYVLIGANMPSILAEINFVSHPDEETLLRSSEYRDRIARSLLNGVRNYLQALSRTPKGQLTSAARGNKLAEKEVRR